MKGHSLCLSQGKQDINGTSKLKKNKVKLCVNGKYTVHKLYSEIHLFYILALKRYILTLWACLHLHCALRKDAPEYILPICSWLKHTKLRNAAAKLPWGHPPTTLQ